MRRGCWKTLDDYGLAIKQLAAAEGFPGDMLLKNFRESRHGRVVFYDYHEICYLTKRKFRRIPEPRTPEEEMASEPWYSIGPLDLFFPEEFPPFLFAEPEPAPTVQQPAWPLLRHRVLEGRAGSKRFGRGR